MGERNALIFDRIFLIFLRRVLTPFPGWVGRRTLRKLVAFWISLLKRSTASSRLRSWDL